MSKLSKQQLSLIATALKNRTGKITATKSWIQLATEFNLGELRDNSIHFSRADYQTLREITIADSGYDPSTTRLTGSRTEVSRITVNEKFSNESIIGRQVSCTAIGGPLIIGEQHSNIITGIEYRVDSTLIDHRHYDAVLVVENYEAFLFVHQFIVPDLGHVLVLYRGHDVSAAAVINLIDGITDFPLIGFTDPDPAGVGLLNDNPSFSHALIPDTEYLVEAPSVEKRFATQLAARPNIKKQCEGKNDNFRKYANWMVDKGFASTQEWLCSHSVPLILICL